MNELLKNQKRLTPAGKLKVSQKRVHPHFIMWRGRKRMDKQIEAKIEELMSLCQEKNANVVVSVVEENNENTTRIFADTEGLQTCMRAIEVVALKYINAKMKRIAKKRPHIHIVDMMGEDADFTSVLERIFGGDKRGDD